MRLFLTGLVTALCLTSTVSFANPGTKLNPRPKPDGSVNLGIQYAYDLSFTWALSYGTDISSEAIKNLPPAIQWNLLNIKTNQLLLQDWTPAGKSDLLGGSIAVSSIKSLRQFLPDMKSYYLVFTDQNLNPLYYFDIGELCAKYPQTVLDLSNTANKACEVSKAQLPDLESKCRDDEKFFADLLQRGLLTCKIANDQLEKRGCNPLSCK